MPKPVPIPVRQKLLERASQGQSVTSLADEYGLSPRTVRHLLKRGREQGEAGLIPGYHAPKPPRHAHPEAVRQAVLALRRDHPSWGAELIRVMLVQAQPQMIGPSPQAIRRWIRAAELARARAGRRAGISSTWGGPEPHQTWQIDASGHIRLGRPDRGPLVAGDPGRGHRGRLLRTGMFSPSRCWTQGRPASDPGQPEAVVLALGPAQAAASRQRLALGGIAGPALPTDLVCWLAGLGVAVCRPIRRVAPGPMGWSNGRRGSASSGASPGPAGRSSSCRNGWKSWTECNENVILREGEGRSHLILSYHAG